MKKRATEQNDNILKNESRKSELKGLLFLAAGLFLLAAYAGLPTGSIGTILNDVLRHGLGLGAVIFPFIFMAMGIGYFRTNKNLVRFGGFWAAMLFYICLLGFLHHMLIPVNSEMEPSTLPNGGGIAGGMLTCLLHSVLGTTGTFILLIAGMLASLVLTGKLSIAALSAKAGDKIEDIRAARRERRNVMQQEEDTEKVTPEPAGRGAFFRKPDSENRNPGSMDVYNRDEFSEFNEDVRKESVFKQILGFGNKKQEKDTDVTGFNDPWPDRPKGNNRVSRAGHESAVKEKPALTEIYPEKPETVVLRPASGIITGHRDLSEPAPWEKDAIIPKPGSDNIPVSHYGEKNGSDVGIVSDVGNDSSGFAEETRVDGSTESGYILTPHGITKVTGDPAKMAVAAGPGNILTTDKTVPSGRIEKQPDKGKCGTEPQASPGNNSESHNTDETSSEKDNEAEYIFPPLELLNPAEKSNQRRFDAGVREQCRKLEQTLKEFRVNAKVTGVTRGPSVTRYELEPAPGVKVSSVVNLADDIALRLAATGGVRVEAPIPGKAAIGIEAPNITNDMVSFREIVDCDEVRRNSSRLCVGLGKDIEGKVITIDLSKMPHLLIAGTTGSGKSVCVNTLLAGIMYKARPEEVKLILVDPKVVELTNYNGIPHLLVPVVTDAKKAASALHWAVAEMERRYNSFADTRVRDINAYNAQAEEKMPYIVIVIDEMSDLMMVAKADVEDAILRLAQKARACGIHMVLATQRPSVDVITGIVKANIPSRIAFAVSSLTDSRTILDMGGAEKLLGKGDMLFYPIGSNKPLRVQGAFVSDEELNRVTDFIKKQAIPVEYSDEVTNVALPSDSQKEAKNAAAGGGEMPEEEVQDELLDDAIRLVLDLGQASASMLQRRFRIGYNRAARLVETMEELGIVGPAVGSKPRELLLSKEEVEYRFLNKDNFNGSQ